jgi:hypothetical protein
VVATDKGETATAKAAPGDDEQLVANGVYWWQAMTSGTCRNRFPIRYGESLKGTPFAYRDGAGRESGSVVTAKPLRIGIVYKVSTTGGNSGSGTGWFRIAPDRHVETWPDDPTPGLRDEDGYSIEETYEPPPSQRP